MGRSRARGLALWALALAACGPGPGEAIDASRADASGCRVSADCDDGVFCDGVESCVAGRCAPGPAVCTGQFCDEANRQCTAPCSGEMDADGDGARAIACGGEDCDDHDPARAPGLAETCDAAGVDEDCDPTTLGTRDADGDGYVDAACCNVRGDGARDCGPDCDDAQAGTHPGVPEACNATDDDCDGATDEGLSATTYYADCDGDLFGTAASAPLAACAPPTGAPASCASATARWSDAAGDCDDHDPRRQRACGACAAVDLLLVVDNSGGITPVVEQLANEYAALADALATGDTDRDHVPDTEPIESLRVGFVTSDMALGAPVAFAACGVPFDDGALLTTAAARVDASCATNYPSRWTGFVPDDPRSDPVLFARELACRSDQGTTGCGFELPLEAALRAVTPSTSSLRFFDPTAGRTARGLADGANRSFLRPGAILVVGLVQQEDDCTAMDASFYTDDASAPDPNVRCSVWSDRLVPTSRFVDGLAAVVPPGDLVLFEIVGAPTARTASPGSVDLDALLADPLMSAGRAPCVAASGVATTAARRMVTVARDLEAQGAHVVVESMCDASYASGIDALVRTITQLQHDRCGS
ncbi:MAG: putative metal-binding motif-containing protein [Sandaracinus sp.]